MSIPAPVFEALAGVVGRLAPNCRTQNGVVPRTEVPEVPRIIRRVRRVFDPERRRNPHKIFPAESARVEVSAPQRRAAR